MRMKRFVGTAALLIAGLLGASAQGLCEDFRLVGSWKTKITIPGRPGGPLDGVMMVNLGGTMLYSDITQVVPQRVGPNPTDIAFTTPSHGVWQRNKDGFTLTHVEVLASPNTSTFGFCTTTFVIHLTADSEEFSGDATYTCVDAQGNSGGPPATAPVTGKRISADN